ncbi:pyridoxamine 5'-phosphate oxidase family protein [Zobellia sp. 1_MG-2023]|uniref:pyridoxamine 5'-phosphate oxidase family protein n=1 Tax=Zobellia sp. 1_MG-2023 TaxID=3062626 RepID=UPI0026E1EB15|nr:pyridoxamine 5'-phosphate oxidase family protein [Zobellia sp. 1_MG-2023]MDO6820517.1 pyridoxamine 5'-phosphate oxidase family protein [Zobellia sp. 1_MG-2023]
MTSIFWDETLSEIKKGIAERRHPFRFFTLATMGKSGTPSQRTVVFRHFNDNLSLVFYTDKRSQKVKDIENKADVSLLFYHPENLLQIVIKGKASKITKPEILKEYWSAVPDSNKKDYTTQVAPGSIIKAPDTITYLDDRNHFCAIEIVPDTIEYLKLKRPNHIRVLFSKTDASWEGEFLTP